MSLNLFIWGFIQQRVSAKLSPGTTLAIARKQWTWSHRIYALLAGGGGRNNEPMEKQFKKKSFLKQDKVIECHETPLEWVVLRVLRGGDI